MITNPWKVKEDQPFTFDIVSSNVIALSDVDVDTDDLEVTLSVANGILTIDTGTGAGTVIGDIGYAGVEGLAFAPGQRLALLRELADWAHAEPETQAGLRAALDFWAGELAATDTEMARDMAQGPAWRHSEGDHRRLFAVGSYAGKGGDIPGL